jgi:death-on-curing protein
MTLKVIGYIYLDEDDVKDIHKDQLEQHGGLPGIRDPGGLASAISQPQGTYGGEDLYPDAFSKAAVLGFCISEGQVFVDGNKRTGLVAALAFLKINGHDVPPAEERLYDAMIAMAKKQMDKEGFAELLRELVCEFNSRKDDNS